MFIICGWHVHIFGQIYISAVHWNRDVMCVTFSSYTDALYTLAHTALNANNASVFKVN